MEPVAWLVVFILLYFVATPENNHKLASDDSGFTQKNKNLLIEKRLY